MNTPALRSLAFAFAIALAGCADNSRAADNGDGGGGGDGSVVGPGGGSSAIYVNGSRLVWRKLTTDDGLQSIYDLYDQQLGATCYAQHGSDGQLRCIPYFPSATLSNYYADSSCTTRLAFASCPPSTPKFAYDTNGSNGYIIYPVTGTYTGAIYTGGSTCTASTAIASFSYFTVGAALPPDQFEPMTAHGAGQGPQPSSSDLEQDGTRIRLETVTSDDGAVSPHGFYDAQLAAECYFSTTFGSRRCYPSQAMGSTEYFADASCTQPLLTQQSSSAHYNWAYQWDPSQCAVALFFQVAGAYSGTLYENLGTTCSSTTPGSGDSYWSLTSIGADTFAAATLAAASGAFAGMQSGSRIQLNVTSSADGARTLSGFHDAQLDADCYFTVAGDGVLRCVPSPMAYAQLYYADSSCTQPLAVWNGCDTPRFVQTTGTCNATYNQVGAAFTGTPYEDFGDGSGCKATTVASSQKLYELGAAIPASTFAAGTIAP
jgi:hypothetical protein